MRARSVQPAMSFEYFMWIFTRGSGIALILLALIPILYKRWKGERRISDIT